MPPYLGVGKPKVSRSPGVRQGIDIRALPSAWALFDSQATPIDLIASHNISGISDDGTGKNTITFSQAMDNTDYIVIGFQNHTNANAFYQVDGDRLTVPLEKTVNAVKMIGVAGSGTKIDSRFVNVLIFGGRI